MRVFCIIYQTLFLMINKRTQTDTIGFRGVVVPIFKNVNSNVRLKKYVPG